MKDFNNIKNHTNTFVIRPAIISYNVLLQYLKKKMKDERMENH